MFTGIIEGFGVVVETTSSGLGKRLGFKSDFTLENTNIGDSIAVNGACLTVIALKNHKQFQADVSPETLRTTNLGNLRIGQQVNLERALRLTQRIDGHLVSGHIDGISEIKHIATKGNAWIITIGVSSDLSRYMIQKGSVAVDGVSLTINECGVDFFQVAVIPHTAQKTTIALKKQGDLVNIETDLIGKYIEKFVTNSAKANPKHAGAKKSVDLELLQKTGFI